LARRTLRPEVLAGIGGFGALCQIPKKYRHPVLVSGTDGVGTKLKLAFERQRHDTVGIDLVAMSVNDILACGGEPLFFLDYYVCEKLDVRAAAQVVKGTPASCQLSRCASYFSGCNAKATSPRTRCSACSIAASAWFSAQPPRTPSAPPSCCARLARQSTRSA